MESKESLVFMMHIISDTVTEQHTFSIPSLSPLLF